MEHCQKGRWIIKTYKLTLVVCLAVIFSSCSSSDDDDSVPPMDGRSEFPSFRLFAPAPMRIVSTTDLDNFSTVEQVGINAATPLTDEDGSTITLDGTSYSTLCQASYMATQSNSAGQAYQELSTGLPDTVFAFEDSMERVNLFSINPVVTDQRTGQEYFYNFLVDNNEIFGRGRAFYFNSTTDNLTRSAIVYFECFGFEDSFNSRAALIQQYLDSVSFGPFDDELGGEIEAFNAAYSKVQVDSGVVDVF